MQAHSLSNPAAWNTPFLPSLPSTDPQPACPTSLAEGAGLAHDAGNLLAALSLYCDLLDSPGVLRPEHLHYAREIRFLSQRSSALIGRLLDGSAPDATPPHNHSQCPAKVLCNLAPLLRSLVSPESELRIEAPSHLPRLPFSAETFERILVNLTRNAATALRRRRDGIPGEPAVTIQLQLQKATEETPQRLALTIADNAGGMTPSTAATFLKPAPLPAGATRGLGHRIVHELLASTHGDLFIHVVNGLSTTLRIEWTLASQPASFRESTRRSSTSTLEVAAC